MSKSVVRGQGSGVSEKQPPRRSTDLLVAALCLWLIIIAPGRADAQQAVAKAARWKDGEGRLTVGGAQVWYRIEGAARNGVPILFLHGGETTARPFELTLGPLLALTHPVVYMDFRGTGRSTRPTSPSEYSLERLADDADSLIHYLGMERWTLFGHALGGAVAIIMAARHPDSIGALILCDPLIEAEIDLEQSLVHKVLDAPDSLYEEAAAIYRSDQPLQKRRDELLALSDPRARLAIQFYEPDHAQVFEQVQQELAERLGKPLVSDAFTRGLLEHGFFAFNAYRYSDRLAIPTLLIAGLYDSEISVDNAMRFAVRLPYGRAVVLDHSGHHPYLEETITTATLVEQFLGQLVD